MMKNIGFEETEVGFVQKNKEPAACAAFRWFLRQSEGQSATQPESHHHQHSMESHSHCHGHDHSHCSAEHHHDEDGKGKDKDAAKEDEEARDADDGWVFEEHVTIGNLLLVADAKP